MTTLEGEAWEFKMIPELVRRLSKLPRYQTEASLPTLPAELQYQIFSYLDLIDSACLGLSSPPAYTVFRSIHGTKMPLNTRCIGPNTIEAAWEVVEKEQCNSCGMYRCELHSHIKSWMPEDLEYCHLNHNFGQKAEKDANPTCCRGIPRMPKRCGRHPLRTAPSTNQSDLGFNY